MLIIVVNRRLSSFTVKMLSSNISDIVSAISAAVGLSMSLTIQYRMIGET